MKRRIFYDKNKQPDLARQHRYDAIIARLTPLIGQKPVNKTLDREVIITEKSIGEIAEWASLSAKSTEATNDLLRQIRNAHSPRFDIPKKNQRNKFHFEFTIVMESTYRGEKTKVVVGINAKGSVIQYCLTVPQ